MNDGEREGDTPASVRHNDRHVQSAGIDSCYCMNAN